MTLPEIILAIKPELEAVSAVHALWLEGSYATGKFRPDSDIDVWMDVDDDAFTEVYAAFERSLQSLGVLRRVDELRIYHEDPKLAKAKFYLINKTDDQRIELDLQPHSRNFIFSRKEHVIQVFFDKDNTIRWQS